MVALATFVSVLLMDFKVHHLNLSFTIKHLAREKGASVLDRS